MRVAERTGFLAWMQRTGAVIVMVQETTARPDQVIQALREPPECHVNRCAAEITG